MSPKNCPYCGVVGCRFIKWGKTKQKRTRYKCPECKRTFTNRTGTIRHRTRLSDAEWKQAAKLVSLRTCPSGADLGRYFGVHRKTGQSVLRQLRGFMPPSHAGPKLDGVVEFDESLMQKVWVVGGVSRRNNKLRLYSVCKRDSQTLRTVVEDASTYNAIVLTDEWKGYRQVKYGREHHTVNHSETFVDKYFPGIHTQRIEGCWGRAKPLAKHTHRGYHNLPLFLNHTCFLHNFSHHERKQFLLSITFPHLTNTRLA